MAHVCAEPGCPDLAVDRRHCEKHKREPWNSIHRPGGKRARLRKRVFARDRGLCQPCKRAGIRTRATQVDHKTPLAWGGKDEGSNCQAICVPCHKAKSMAETHAARAANEAMQ